MALDDERRERNNQIPVLSLSLKFEIYLVGTGHFLKPEEAFPSPCEKVCFLHTY
jgi:hypothetical protein